MGLEIERKFLVKDGRYAEMADSSSVIRQAYISDRVNGTVRVRVKGARGYLTVKGANEGAVRHEWEYEVPLADAEEMAVKVAGGWSIDKTRYIVPWAGRVWEVDEFHGRHEGLVLAEVELPDAEAEVKLPPFVGEEVTGDPRYYNSVLAGTGRMQ
ncbi:MAG: CYTH domain-containing protein [Duncaniella sp.]|nr:CYTH domain-containing protein [Duncaniella sp.]MDE6467098.1 CYTH domain-containing protein [Duncaniella sp.]